MADKIQANTSLFTRFKVIDAPKAVSSLEKHVEDMDVLITTLQLREKLTISGYENNVNHNAKPVKGKSKVNKNGQHKVETKTLDTLLRKL